MGDSQHLKIFDRLYDLIMGLRSSGGIRPILRIHPRDASLLLKYAGDDTIFSSSQPGGDYCIYGVEVVRDAHVPRGVARLTHEVSMFGLMECSRCGTEIIDEEFHGPEFRAICISCLGRLG